MTLDEGGGEWVLVVYIKYTKATKRTKLTTSPFIIKIYHASSIEEKSNLICISLIRTEEQQ